MTEAADLERAINESGFPLQLGLKQLVESHSSWHVLLSEHPWRDPLNGDEKFIDLVLRLRYLTLIVECKRARETDWVFLREPAPSDTTLGDRRVTRSFVNLKRAKLYPSVSEWTNVPAEPPSPVVQFCVIRKNNQRSQELLEKSAAEVVRATEAIAQQEFAIQRTDAELRQIYTPMIVTTARLFVCDADYGVVDLESGEVADFETMPAQLVRFEKSLGTSAAGTGRPATTLGEAADLSERSVIVARASAFSDILRKWKVNNLPDNLAPAFFGK